MGKYVATRNKVQCTRAANITKGLSKALMSTTAFMAAALLMPMNADAQDATPTHSWDYDTVLDGNVSKDLTIPNVTDITVTNGNGYVEGNADIYNGHTVNVTGDSGSTFAYRDNRADIQSTLDGDLNSNMQIVIIDKDGLFFTENSSVDVQSLIATSGKISVSDIMDNGDLTIKNIANGGEIVLDGTITVAEAGLAAFVSPFVTNSGVINAKLGNVVMASGKKVTLDMYGDGLVEVTVKGELNDALLSNEGSINAEGGTVQITAKAAKDTIDNVINNTGIITASSATVSGGKIILSGGKNGTVNNSGSIETSAGGSVDISGERFVQEGAPPVPSSKPALSPSINTGGGNVNIATSGNVEIYAGEINAEGGNIDIDNGGVFTSVANTLKTNGTGTIDLNQNQDDTPVPTAQILALIEPAAQGIQGAIDAIDNTGTGENTINVGAGTFNESVSVDHANIVLNGANAGTAGYSNARGDETIINPNSPGFHVTADNVTVDGFTVTGGDPGIHVDHAQNASILNNVVTGSTTHGIHFNRAHNSTAQGNSIDSVTESGIFVERSNNTDIGGLASGEGNEIDGAWTGIRTSDSNDISIIGNDISNITGTDRFADGIHVFGGASVDVSNNRIDTTNDEGVYASFTRGNLTITDNVITNVGLATPDIGNGVELIYTKGNANVSGNKITGTEHAGVLIKETNTSGGSFVVDDNRIKNTGASGIDIDKKAASVSGNTISNAGKHGIDVDASSNVVIAGNDLSDITEIGIFLDDSDNAVIGGTTAADANKINRAWTGIRVNDANEADIIGNNIKNITGTDRFADGIHVNGGANVEISHNKIKNTNDEGVYVSFARGHIVIDDNTITNAGLATADIGNGVELIAMKGSAEITNNDINGAEFAGILQKGWRGSGSLLVAGNDVENAQFGVRIDEGIDGRRVDILDNDLKADDVGVLVTGGITNGAHLQIGQLFDGNTIKSKGDGVRIEGGVDDSDVFIVANKITGRADGIHVDGDVTDSIFGIGLNSIKGINDDGIDFEGNVEDSLVAIVLNKSIEGGHDGIEFENTIRGEDTVVAIALNKEIKGGSRGIRFGDSADDAAVEDGATVAIAYNGKIKGKNNDAIQFDAEVNDSTVTITNNKNIIGGDDGIEFDEKVTNSTITIASNDIEADDDGIDFDSGVSGGSVEITDNTIDAGDAGIEFDAGSPAIFGASVLISENDIYSEDGHGIAVNGDITDSLVRIIDNISIDGAEDGIHVAGEIEDESNVIIARNDEIYAEYGHAIALNDGVDDSTVRIIDNGTIDGGDNGINIEGGLDEATVVIARNADIFAEDGHGIAVHSDVSDTDLRIIDNTSIDGGTDGVHVHGALRSGSTITIARNSNVTGLDDDGIEVVNTGFGKNADVRIARNHVHHTGDDGIIVRNVKGVDVVHNTVHDTDGNGIKVSRSAYADIINNDVTRAGDDGIDVEYSYNVDILLNTVKRSGDDGIDVENSTSADIRGNDVSKSRGDGIEVTNSAYTDIINNRVRFSGDDGIDVDRSFAVDIKRNSVFVTGGNGIEVTNSRYADIIRNNVAFAGDDGIDVGYSSFADVNGNNVYRARGDGIEITGGYGVDVKGNDIYSSGDDGIDIEHSNGAEIAYNYVTGSRVNGIEVSDSNGVDITDNGIFFSGNNGIDVRYGGDINVRRNFIRFSRNDGIHAEGIYGYGASFTRSNGGNGGIDIVNNNIRFSGDDGIDVEGSNDVNIRRNLIRDSRDDGIDVSYSYDVDIINNRIIRSGDNGIEVRGGGDINIRRNFIRRSGSDGIHAENVYGGGIPTISMSRDGTEGGLYIVNNDVRFSGDDGIEVQNSSSAKIKRNTISDSEDDGISSRYNGSVVIARNEVDESGDDGIYVVGGGFKGPQIFALSDELQEQPKVRFYGSSAVIRGNTVTNSGGDGVHTNNIDNLRIVNNNVSDSFEHGVYVSGAYNGYVKFQGNTLTDNGHLSDSAAARFESGDIDMSNLDNPNTFINTSGLPAVAMQFDDISGGVFPSDAILLNDGPSFMGGNGLRIVGETLGSTIFDGYTPEDSFYVRFEDGSILDPLTGAPIVIDAMDVSFDGLVPNTFAGGVLPAPVFDFIEERLFDADDETQDGRGQIFIGTRAQNTQGPANFQDFLPESEAASRTSNGASLVITGLPSVNGFGADALNNIAPNAGGEGNENPEDLANIDPAAGGEEQSPSQVTCMGDAVGALESGSVSYSFGGSFEDSIAGTSSCASADL
ncbi:MAG: right-handed parallel beta-helix repeat-containing protein [Alphaproteobacteria bacterium]